MSCENDKKGDINNYFSFEKEMMLKKTCYNLECVGLPKSKWSRLDSEKYVGQERKLNSGIQTTGSQNVVPAPAAQHYLGIC